MKEVLTMTKYREILRLSSLGFSNRNIALSVPCSRNTVSKVLKRAKELNLSWPLSDDQTDAVLEQLLYPKLHNRSNRRMPDYDYIRKELLRNGVSKKLLWTEYIEDCRANGDEPLMYSQFCYHIQQDEQKHRATMHIKRKPAEQIEVDWAGDPAMIIDPDTGEIIKAHIFVGVMTYSQYTYVEAFLDMKQRSWIKAHIHMYEYFGGVAKILVPDNCKTAVIHNGKRKDQQINQIYQELAEHYGTAIIPARVRSPKDKPNAEGTVGNISTWITAALRNEQFFSLAELNRAIRKKLLTFNQKLFQKKEGSRLELFLENEKPLLSPLPATRFELSDWKTATVQFNYHISVDKMLYSFDMKIIKGPSIEELISKAYIGLGSASFIRVDEVRFFPSMFLLIRENDDILYKLRFLQKIQYPLDQKRVYRMLDGKFFMDVFGRSDLRINDAVYHFCVLSIDSRANLWKWITLTKEHEYIDQCYMDALSGNGFRR